jgi:hypothetical protein
MKAKDWLPEKAVHPGVTESLASRGMTKSLAVDRNWNTTRRLLELLEG